MKVPMVEIPRKDIAELIANTGLEIRELTKILGVPKNEYQRWLLAQKVPTTTFNHLSYLADSGLIAGVVKGIKVG